MRATTYFFEFNYKYGLVGVIFFLLSYSLFAATVSATYSSGDIPTNYNTYSSSCNGAATPLNVTLPAGGPWNVTAVSVDYSMTAASSAWKSEQRSKLYCQNTTTGEASYTSGVGSSTGTYVYPTRSGLTIANGAYAGGTTLTFELQAYRTWGGSGCNSTYNKVDNNTWTVTVTYSLATPMTYVSSTTTQNSNDVGAGSTNNQVIGIEVVTLGSASPLSVDGFRFRTNGTTDYANDIQNAKVFYTGTSSTFSTSTQFGSTYASPPAPGSNMDIIASQTLAEGTNYFWLTYDVQSGATVGNYIDATCQLIDVSSSYKTPSTTAPAGSRQIILSADISWPGLDLGTLSCGSTTSKTGNTTGAADDCTLGGGHVGADHMYQFTISEEANVTVSTCNGTTAFNTKLFMYNSIAGECSDQSYTAFNYTGSSGSCGGTKAEIIAEGLGAGTYVVVLKGTSAAEGAYQLDFVVDNCISAVDDAWPGYDMGTLDCPYSRTFSGNTTTSNDDCTNATGGEDIYSLTLSETMTVDISTCNSGTDFDTYLYLYNLSTGNCATAAGLVTSNNDGGGSCGTSSEISTSLAAGSYVVLVEGNSGATGNYELTVSAEKTCLDALGANNVSIGSLPYSVTSQTTSGSGNELTSSTAVTTSCGSTSYYSGEDHVYEFTPSASGSIQIDMTSSTSYTSIMLYEGCPLQSAYSCGATEGTCEAYVKTSSSGTKTINYNVSAGTTYYLVLDIYASPSNYTYDLSISAPSDCSGSLGTGVTTVGSLPYSGSGSTAGAVNDLTSSNMITCGSTSYLTGEDEVYVFTPSESGNIDISMTSATSYTGMKLYEGCPLTGQGGVCIDDVGTSSSGTKTLAGCVEAGKTYYLILDTYASPNNFSYSSLTISAPYCNIGSGNVNIGSLPYSATSQTTSGTGNDITGSSAHVECWYSSAANSTGLDKVYIFTPSTTGEITIDATNVSTNSAMMTLYEGCPVNDCSAGSCAGYLHQNTDPVKTLNANVTAGETYYLVMDRMSSGTAYTFDLDITAPGTLADDENFCTSAPALASSPTNLNVTGLATGTGDYPSDFDDVSCIDNASGNVDNNIWFKFVPTQTSVSFEFNNISSNSVQAEIFSSTDGKCGTLQSVATYCNTSCTAGDFSLTASVTVGETYYLMIDGCAGVTPAFDLSTYGLSSGSAVLPIELSYFETECNDNAVEIKWQTASEINNEYFTLERSKDGVHFEPIAKIEGAGTSSELNRYSFIDETANGNEYYVLRQTDFDGKYDYSQIIKARCKVNEISDFAVYPNPSTGEFTIQTLDIIEEQIDVLVSDVYGRVVVKETIQNQNQKRIVLGDHLPNGTYFLRLANEAGSRTQKIVKL